MSTLRASCHGLLFLSLLLPSSANGEEKARPLRPKITVSKETTFFLGPLDKDGYVDYVAALNQHFSRGVTPENNANVLLWRASGPFSEGGGVPKGIFELLRMEPPKKEGTYLVDFGKYVREHAKIATDAPEFSTIIDDFYKRAASKPWVEPAYPHAAIFLKFNEAPLAVIVEGTKRPNYFSPIPLDTEERREPLAGVILYGAQSRREYGRMLIARAMLRLGERRLGAAWNDLLASHRLARHVARGPWLIENLIGVAIDGIATAGDVAFLGHADLSATQGAKCLRDLQALPPLPAMADKIDISERAMFLDAMQLTARYGREVFDTQLLFLEAEPPSWIREFDAALIDWDAALKMGNEWYDRLVAALHIEDRQKMAKAFEEIDANRRDLTTESKSDAFPNKKLLATDAAARKTAGRRVAGLMIRLLHSGGTAARTAEDRAKQNRRNVQVAFALAAYRADEGRYPEKLAELSPRYLLEIPQDAFAGKPLIYRAAGGAYVLYSVGMNGKDDGGYRNGEKPDADDLVIRMPPEE